MSTLTGSNTFSDASFTVLCPTLDGTATESYAGTTDPGTMTVDGLQATRNASGDITDLTLSVEPITNGPGATYENVSLDWNFTGGTGCHSLVEALEEYGSFDIGAVDSALSANGTDLVLKGWSINPSWTPATGGLLATKTVSGSTNFSAEPDPNAPADSGPIRATQTFTVSTCGGSAAASAGPGVQLQAGACGLTITSPPADATIALTDGKYFQPQPGPAERQPEQRKLTVEGTAPAGVASITFNGMQVPVNGGKWKAELPVTMAQLGQLTLKASDGTDTVQQTNTLIDLEITSPTEDQDLPITTEPAMPSNLDGMVEVAGYGGDTSNVTFDWVLNVRGKYRTRCGGCRVGEWKDYSEDVATGSQVGTADSWQPDYNELLGGWGRLEVTADLPGVLDNPVTSEPRWVNIPGANPGKAAAEGFIDDHAGDLADTDKHIACWESGHTFNQFSSAADGREPPSDTIPANWKPNPAPLRPLFGGLPAGIGMMQKDPAAFPGMQWNWHDNVLAGIAEYAGDYATAGNSRAEAQRRLDSQLKAVLAVVNAARKKAGLPPLHENAIHVPELTENQRTRQALSFYNRGPKHPEYQFDATYAPTADHLNVRLTGTRRWEQIHYAEDYPTSVLTCKI